MIVKYPVTQSMRQVVEKISSADFIAYLQERDTAATGYTSQIQAVNYYHGHIWELIQHLKEMAQSPETKKLRFPFIWLPEDITYNINPRGYSTATVRLIVCHHTEQKYSSEQREQKVFEPVLRPIAEELIKGIANNRQFFVISDRANMTFDYTERKFWGREEFGDGTTNTANKLNDYVDAIDIQGLEIPLSEACYYPQNIN